MNSIITTLIFYIKYQTCLINILMTLLFGKSLYDKLPKPDKCEDIPYNRLVVDIPPILEFVSKNKSYNYKDLLKEYFCKNNKELKPIVRRTKSSVPTDLFCPSCNAPHEYIYLNNGSNKNNQFLCKICSEVFSNSKHLRKELIFHCPYCDSNLHKTKSKSSYDIYRCNNSDCSYYKTNLNALTEEQRKNLSIAGVASPKLHYIFRSFNLDFVPFSSTYTCEQPKVQLSNIRINPQALGTILTYTMNYGISARATANLMFDVHNFKISHQSILNYIESTSYILKPFLDGYKGYDTPSVITADETYIKVLGRWHYIFFFTDPVRKTILSRFVSPNRDVDSCIRAMDEAFSKINPKPTKISLSADGNPIYLIAAQFYKQFGIDVDVGQVIGLSNNDEFSKKNRYLKQIVERHNRTFKHNYHQTHGFMASKSSNNYLTVFSCCFNFLRPHSAIDYQTPVIIPEIVDTVGMPNKWTKLLELSQNFILENQVC